MYGLAWGKGSLRLLGGLAYCDMNSAMGNEYVWVTNT